METYLKINSEGEANEFKDTARDLYERSVGLNLLDADGNAVVNLRGFDYKFRVGENG